MEGKILFLPEVIWWYFKQFSKLLVMFWHLSICISLFVWTNRSSMCMLICQTNTDIQKDRHLKCLFQNNFCKSRVCTTESLFFTNKPYILVILLCEGSAKIYKTLQWEQETHLCFCKTCIGLAESQPKGSGGNKKTGGCTFWEGTYPWQEQFSHCWLFLHT